MHCSLTTIVHVLAFARPANKIALQTLHYRTAARLLAGPGRGALVSAPRWVEMLTIRVASLLTWSPGRAAYASWSPVVVWCASRCLRHAPPR
jgi:hypothetical protein